MKTMMLGLLSVSLLCGCATFQADREQPLVSLAKLVSTVQSTIAQIDTGLANRDAPRVKEATIALKTSVEKQKGGQLSIAPVSAKRGTQDSSSGTLTIQLSPSPRYRQPTAGADTSVSHELAGAVLSAVENVSNATQGPFPMKLEQVSIEVSFDAETTKSGGIQIIATNASLGGGRQLSKSDSHVLTLVLAQK